MISTRRAPRILLLTAVKLILFSRCGYLWLIRSVLLTLNPYPDRNLDPGKGVGTTAAAGTGRLYLT